MPRNANGIYTLPPLNPVVPFTVIATQWANTTLPDIAAALTNSIAADGVTTVTANLPMNGFRHTGVGQALTATQYAQSGQAQGFVFNVATNIASDVTGTQYTALVPFGIGSTAPIPVMMPLLFVPDKNNGGPATLALNGGTPVPIINSDLTALAIGQIKVNRPYALCYTGGNWVLVTNTLELAQLNTVYVRLNGGTMTGPLILSQDPTDTAGAATKNYVDNAVVGSIGGVASFNTRVGAVTLLSLDVTAALGYTPANIAGSAFTGNVSAPQVSATAKVIAPVFQNTAQVNAAATGAIAVDAALTQNHVWTMTGNIVLTVTNPVIGQILRFLLLSTTGRTVTWPATTFWPDPTPTPPILDLGTQKACLVVLEYTGANWIGNASIY